MKRVGILSLRWGTVALVGAALALPQVLRGQGPAEGVKVHGHWVIEVRNVDGTLQLRREFENALTDMGRFALSGLLTGEYTVSNWRVQTNANAGCGPPPCIIQLTVANELTGPAVLNGRFVAVSTGNVTNVTALMTRRFGTFNNAEDPFSSRSLTPPIPVQPTQTVAVTVTFSFQ